MSKENLEEQAQMFRLALEDYLHDHPEVTLSSNLLNPARSKFPIDSCKATSFMFGYYLSKIVDCESLFYVHGTREKVTHGWLKCDGFFLDLTADQFDDEDRTVIVETAEDSEWHKSFEPHHVHSFDLAAGHELEQIADEVSMYIR